MFKFYLLNIVLQVLADGQQRCIPQLEWPHIYVLDIYEGFCLIQRMLEKYTICSYLILIISKFSEV